MKAKRSMEEFFSATITGETTPIEHLDHPHVDLMLAVLEGETSIDVQSRLNAHIATCDSCRARWNRLTWHLKEACEVQEAKSHVPSLDAHIKRWLVVPPTLADRLRLLFETRVVVVAAVSAAALALAFALAIPFVRGPALRTSQQIEALDDRLAVLQQQLDGFGVFRPFGDDISVGEIDSPGIAAADLEALDWSTLAPYVVRPADTWERIAEEELGNPSLWPLVWLLNRETAPPDTPPPAGATVVLPAPKSSP